MRGGKEYCKGAAVLTAEPKEPVTLGLAEESGSDEEACRFLGFCVAPRRGPL